MTFGLRKAGQNGHHEKVAPDSARYVGFNWTDAKTPVCSRHMKQLRPAFLRFLMVCIVATIVTGTLGMGAAGPFPDTETTHMAGHTAMDPGSDCPVAAKSNAHRQTGHGACALTICCFSEAPDLTALKPDFELMPARYVLSVEPRLTQSEPERAKKPPRHA